MSLIEKPKRVAKKPIALKVKKPVAKPKKPKSIIHVALILDNSNSMGYLVQHAQDLSNRVMASYNKSKLSKTLSMYTFGDRVTTVFEFQKVAPVYVARDTQGMTAFSRSLLHAIERLRAFAGYGNRTDAFVINMITDGDRDNSSSQADKEAIKPLILELMTQGNWTFTFQVPCGKTQYFADNYGLPVENIMEWEGTAAGVAKAAQDLDHGTQSFMDQRSRGATQSKSFFVDLSKFNDTKLRQLTLVSKQFRRIKIDKEARIDEFVAEKTKKPYLLGSGYYELTKPEKVQPEKNMLIMKKGTTDIYGGMVRQTLGFPSDETVKVEPGNLKDYSVFVQSKAPNRKLVRGTTLLFDKNKLVNDQCHFDTGVLQ